MPAPPIEAADDLALRLPALGRHPGLRDRRRRRGPGSQLTDDLLANGDLHEALQRMLNRGWRTPDGEQVQGLRDLLDQLRLRAGGAARQRATWVGPTARSPRSSRRWWPRSGPARPLVGRPVVGRRAPQEVTDEVATERRMELDLLPGDLAGMVRGLQN